MQPEETQKILNLPWISGEFPKVASEAGECSATSNPIFDVASETFFANSLSKETIHYFQEQNAAWIFLTVVVKNKNDPRFGKAKVEEVDKFVKLGTYGIVPEPDISSRGPIFQSRFVLTVKNYKDGTEFFKARLAMFGNMDPEKPRVVNEAQTVLKFSIGLLLALISSCGFPLWSPHITFAFLQSKDKLKRDICVRPPKKRKRSRENWSSFRICIKGFRASVWTCWIPRILVADI